MAAGRRTEPIAERSEWQRDGAVVFGFHDVATEDETVDLSHFHLGVAEDSSAFVEARVRGDHDAGGSWGVLGSIPADAAYRALAGPA